MSAVKTRVLTGFDDPSFPPAAWSELLPRGGSDVVFLTPAWQRAWWETFGRGDLLLVVATRDGADCALAPFFADSGMTFFVGAGGSDYLDLVGDTSDPDVLDALLETAADRTPGFVGFRLHHVPDGSPTGERLRAAAERRGLVHFDEGSLPAPTLDLADGGAERAAAKSSLVRHEKGFRRDGTLAVEHLTAGGDILAHLDELFEQHVARWAGTPYPSLFLDERERELYRRLARTGAPFLRLTRIVWDGKPVALHFGSHHAGRYLWYKPSYDVTLAKRSPGEVLLRHLILAAAAEGARELDLGLGDEGFKSRFATRVEHVRTHGLYPRAVVEVPSCAS